MSRWTRHRDKWQKCIKCELCEGRQNVVLLKGRVPCNVLFIGEAPGVGEDVLGKPFVGPAGHLLTKMMSDAIPPWVKVAFTNLVACIPLDPDGNKVKEPHKEHIQACGDRLREVYKIAQPQAVVFVGKLSGKWVPKILDGLPKMQVTIVHPAAILRADVSQKGLAIQRTIVQLQDLIEELEGDA